MQRKNYIRPTLIAIAVLMIPFIGNLTVDGWNWGFFDFVFFFVLLYAAGFVYELLANKTSSTMCRVVIGGVVVLGVLAIWAELAVGAVEQAVLFLISS
jgi:hypothetical protein